MPVIPVKHPLLEHKLNLLRDKNCPDEQFRRLLHEITLLLAFPACQSLLLTDTEVETPLEKMKSGRLSFLNVPVLMPILRAGLGMLDAMLELIPEASVGHIGVYRDEKTLQPNFYFYKLPEKTADRPVIILDPMLATGGSLDFAISRLKQDGIRRISAICLLASPEGCRALEKKHSDVTIFAAAVDRQLNDRGFILPGLGDAGDRIFGTGKS